MKKDNYYKAFMAFGDAVDDFMARAASGRPSRCRNIPKTPEENIKYRLIWSHRGLGSCTDHSLVCDFFVEKAACFLVRQANYASEYIRQNSMALNISRHFSSQQVRKSGVPPKAAEVVACVNP